MNNDLNQPIAIAPDAPPTLTRRRWLRRAAWATVACGVGCVVDTFFVEPYWLDLTTRELPIAKLPPRLEGCTLAQISDIHLGHQVSESFLLESFARLSALQPDIVVVTGDYISLDPAGAAPLVAARRIYGQLPQGRLATLGILGNHDYGVGWGDANVAQRLIDILGECGMQVLRNETHAVEGLQIVGIDDIWALRCDIPTAVASSDAATARLVLCHNPDAADFAGWGDYQGWILAGHTHGGQCKPPFLPPPLLPVSNRRYTSGEIDLFDGRRLYINRGLGHLLRVRFNARPEITLFRLTAA